MNPKLNWPPTALIFDLDETLVHFGLLDDQFASAVNIAFPQAPTEARAALAANIANRYRATWNTKIWRADWRHSHRVRWIVSRVVAQTPAPVFGLSRAKAIEEILAGLVLVRRDVQSLPQALETLAELKGRGLALALLTNGPAATQRPKIERYGLDRIFDYIQVQGEFGIGKPDERAYRTVLGALSVGPGQACMVGDDLEWDVAAPQRLGLAAIWHDYLGGGLPSRVKTPPYAIIRGPGDLPLVLATSDDPRSYPRSCGQSV